ncbi:MAG TPA: phosphoglycerate dehydrogenase [Acidimicrobiales bacterium]|jgi:D-3-phosphoglycerate dehydrogenase / 2-oxoglutarate reductase|nr:phosphoglycerate dehydrogenase [Acidimicrobiales bacterium]
MPRILVTEPLAESGLALLREAGHDVDVQLGLSPEELLSAIKGASALIVRSATKVTAEVFDAADALVAVGRAGAGVDNIDVTAATRKGVMVINAPGSNSLSTAEHAVALLLALARNVPQAHGALKAGRWEKSRWEGVELHGKTLGVLGLGRIGTLVAQRMNAFGMRVIARDPFVTPERARQLGIELVDSYEELVGQSDFLTIHANKTKETAGLIGKDLLAHAKPGLRIVNAARGGIVDEVALAEAISSGRVAGAALDVFETEPTTESPLFELDNVVVTPHLAASTQEAQDKAGQMIAEQLRLALAGDFVPFAVNVEAAEVPSSVRPFLPLAERLGHLFALLAEDSIPEVLDIAYQGELAGHDTRLLKLAVLRGVLGAGSDEPVSYVNAPQVAEERGMQVRESTTTVSDEYVNLISISGDKHSLAGTLTGRRGDPRIVMLDGHDLEIPLADHLLVVRNDDRVGMMALVTATVAEAGVNIADMRLGRSPGGGTALAVITSDQEIPAGVRERLAGQPGILDVVTVNAS